HGAGRRHVLQGHGGEPHFVRQGGAAAATGLFARAPEVARHSGAGPGVGCRARTKRGANPMSVDRKSLDAADIERRIRALEPALGPSVLEPTAALLAPLHRRAPFPGIAIARDLGYGPDERNRLDVFAPERAPGGERPVLLFVHGGGFTGGDKSLPGAPFYDNVGVW